jgi:hypothetical protein
VTHQSKKSVRFRHKLPLAVRAVLESPTLQKASQTVDVSLSTLLRWRRTPEFADALLCAQQEIFRAMTNEFQQASQTAAEILVKIAKGELPAEPARVRAAQLIVSFVERLNKKETLELRISQLEKVAKQSLTWKRSYHG